MDLIREAERKFDSLSKFSPATPISHNPSDHISSIVRVAIHETQCIMRNLPPKQQGVGNPSDTRDSNSSSTNNNTPISTKKDITDSTSQSRSELDGTDAMFFLDFGSE